MLSSTPIPVVFEPILVPKPWGGRRLDALNKQLPADELIGESWELADLPEGESRIGSTPGTTISKLIAGWGTDLMGAAPLVDGRFPLLIKFLDARENLSVQVHPKPPDEDGSSASTPTAPAIKHEAWYVIEAEPGAELRIGFRDGVTLADAEKAAGKREFVGLLRPWAANAGDSFYLPSGTPHALGGGIMVAEVQTPSDVTYRLYDWERVDAAGRPRELHLGAGLRNLRYDVTPGEISQPRSEVGWSSQTATRVVRCAWFAIDHLRLSRGSGIRWPHADVRIWIVLHGRGELRSTSLVFNQRFGRGDTILIPAQCGPFDVLPDPDCEVLEVHLLT